MSSEAVPELDDDTNLGTTVSSGSVSHLLFILQQTKTDILAEVKSRLDLVIENLSSKIDTESARVVDEILRAIPDRGRFPDWEASKQVEGSGPVKPPPQVKDFNKVVVKDRAIVTMLQWFCLTTVLSFTTANVQARSWVQENVYDRLAGHMTVISGASGFSSLFFAVTNKDGKDKYQSAIGKFWTFMLRSAMVSILLHAKQQFCSGSAEVTSEDMSVRDQTGPAWLSSFGNRKKWPQL